MRRICLICLLLFSSLTIFANESNNEITLETEYQALVDLFFAASRIGDTEVVNTFLQNGFPVDQRNNQSYTALMVAAYNGQRDIVNLLLDSGANACLQDKRGNTALMGALLKIELKIARELYKANCSTEIRNKAGLDLQEFAAMFGQSEALKSLQK